MKAYKDRELKKRGGAATMLKIGEFSKLTQVSVRMLRHYDEIGLLKPAEIDCFTDYRYYKEEQLPAMCRIKALKDMGFSLADIVRIMQLDGNSAALDAFFEVRRAELCAALAETEYRLKLIDIAKKCGNFFDSNSAYAAKHRQCTNQIPPEAFASGGIY